MEWQHVLWSALGIIVTGLASWGVHALVNFLNSKIKDKRAQKLLDDAAGIIDDAVETTCQTYVETLKDKDAFDGEAQEAAIQAAAEKAQSMMCDELKDYLEQDRGGLQEWIRDSITAKFEKYNNKK